jgi:DAK2 domain fusion protein YloV
MTSERRDAFDLPTVLRFSEIALSALAAAREEIDALNVYPVPDGDTGTNLYLTFEAARNAMVTAVGDAESGDLGVAIAAFARGALLGARGNSGVIVSQLVRAVVKRLAESRPDEPPTQVLAEALQLAADAAYDAVGTPVEGTILTVARAAALADEKAAQRRSAPLGHVIRTAASAARDALDQTPEQLQVLKDAGVVDAGGRGLCVILDAAETAATGKRPVTGVLPFGRHQIPVPLPTGDLTPGGPAYEVMYLLDAQDDKVGVLRRTLAPLGDSLVVVGGDGLWNVHVHVDDVGAAVEAGIAAGRPHRIRITHFAEQAERSPRAQPSTRRGRKVLVLAVGAGLGEVFAEAGAVVVPTGQARRPSTGEILEAVLECRAEEVVVLPNDADSVQVAESAVLVARQDHDIRAAVIPTVAQVQGLAAVAVHEPGRAFDDDVVEMTAAARHARSGAVTVAAKQAITSGGPCEPGDVLGMIEGDFVIVGADLFAVAVEVLDRLLGGGGELVTIVSGAEAGDLADRCAAHLYGEHPTVDVAVFAGGQERYPLLFGVE